LDILLSGPGVDTSIDYGKKKRSWTHVDSSWILPRFSEKYYFADKEKWQNRQLRELDAAEKIGLPLEYRARLLVDARPLAREIELLSLARITGQDEYSKAARHLLNTVINGKEELSLDDFVDIGLKIISSSGGFTVDGWYCEDVIKRYNQGLKDKAIGSIDIERLSNNLKSLIDMIEFKGDDHHFYITRKEPPRASPLFDPLVAYAQSHWRPDKDISGLRMLFSLFYDEFDYSSWNHRRIDTREEKQCFEKYRFDRSDIFKELSDLLKRGYISNIPFKDSLDFFIFKSGEILTLPEIFFYNSDELSGIRYDNVVQPAKGYTVNTSQARLTKEQMQELIPLTKKHSVFICLGGGSLKEELDLIIQAIQASDHTEETIDIYSVDMFDSMSTWISNEAHIQTALAEYGVKKVRMNLIKKDFLTCDLIKEVENSFAGLVRQGAYGISKALNTNLLDFYKNADYVIIGTSNVLGNLTPGNRNDLAKNVRRAIEKTSGMAVFGIPLESNRFAYDTWEAKMALYHPLEILGIAYDANSQELCKEDAVRYIHKSPQETGGYHQFFWEFTRDTYWKVPGSDVKVFCQAGSMMQIKPDSGRFTFFDAPNYQDGYDVVKNMRNTLVKGKNPVFYTEQGKFDPDSPDPALRFAQYMLVSVR
jgi:hypothetical protein